MSRWFRMYDDLLDDPKVQRLPPALFKAWVNLLCLASRNEGKLPSIDDVAFSLRVSEAEAEQTISALNERGLLDIDDCQMASPHNWDKRQFKTDNSTERSRKHRSAKGETADATPTQRECNVAATADATPPETEQNRTDSEQSRAERNARAQDPKHWEEVQGYLRDKTDHLTDWEIDFLHSIKWAETLTKSQSDSLKAIAGKLKSPAITGQEVFIVKAGTPEFAAWIAYKRKQGQPTAYFEKQASMTVPSLLPPAEEKAA